MSDGPSKRTFALRLRVPNILTAIHLSNRDRGMRIRLCCLLFLTDQERYNIFSIGWEVLLFMDSSAKTVMVKRLPRQSGVKREFESLVFRTLENS